MNLNKARDFYSAYYEGTLDAGLKQAFERAMATDAEVTAEYRQFEQIMKELGKLDTPVAVPSDLHAKIRERVDIAINASEGGAKKASWFFAWKPIAYGAVATAAIIGVVTSINSNGQGNVAQAGFGVSSNEAPRLVIEEGTVRLQFASVDKNSVTVTEVDTGRQLLNKSLVAQRIDSPLKNMAPTATLLSVSFSNGYSPIYVALPGERKLIAEQGSGTALDLIRAVSDMFGMPVVLESAEVAKKADWTLDSPDVMRATSEELKALGLKAEVRESGLVWISSN